MYKSRIIVNTIFGGRKSKRQERNTWNKQSKLERMEKYRSIKWGNKPTNNDDNKSDRKSANKLIYKRNVMVYKLN